MKLVEMTWPEVAAATGAVAILPLGSIEQHGHHLAVSTDTVTSTAVSEAIEAALPRDVVLCPTLCFGSSHHHLGFPGVMTLAPDTYATVVVELVESLLKGGFRRIVLMNGHGGNVIPAGQALSILSHRYDDSLQPNIAMATYWELDSAAFSGEAPMESTAISHADEYETSLVMHLYPDRVHLDRIGEGPRAAPNAYIDWQKEKPYRGVGVSKAFHYILGHGSNGNPALATAAKGEHLLQRASAAAIEFVGDFKTWPFLADLRQNDQA